MNQPARNLILSIETATRGGGSLAVLSGRDVLRCANRSGEQPSAQSSELLPAIQKILDEAAVKLEKINLIAIAVGPGSFTDLRVGLAIVKGLAAVRETPLIGVPTLEALVTDDGDFETDCALLSAGRGECFMQIFRGRTKRTSEPMRVGQLADLLTELKSAKKVRVVASPEIRQDICEFARQEQINNWSVAAPPENLAVCVGQIAFNLFRQNKFDPESIRLIYGREAVSVRKHG